MGALVVANVESYTPRVPVPAETVLGTNAPESAEEFLLEFLRTAGHAQQQPTFLTLAADRLDRVLFAPTVDPRLKVKEPFTVAIETVEGGVVARIDEINEFGSGATTGDALDDLRMTLRELYFSLQADRDRLSPDLLSVWATLSDHIEQMRP